MKRFVIERDFEYKGFRCVVIFTKGGFRNGYVGYSEPHDLTDEEKEKIESEFRCHGGVTYIGGGKGSHHPVNSDLHWLGFDCAHYGDGVDIDLAVTRGLISKNETVFIYVDPDLHICTEKEVAQECMKLADQMEEAGYHG